MLQWAYMINGIRCGTALMVLGMFLECGAAEPAKESGRLDRKNLLIYRDDSGMVRPVKEVGDWLRRRESILRGMQEIMGPLPARDKRCPLEVKIEEEVDCGTYVRRLVTYSSEPNSRVPAYLLVPKDALAE